MQRRLSLDLGPAVGQALGERPPERPHDAELAARLGHRDGAILAVNEQDRRDRKLLTERTRRVSRRWGS